MSDAPKAPQPCQLCGQPCTVEGDTDDGTVHYQPVPCPICATLRAGVEKMARKYERLVAVDEYVRTRTTHEMLGDFSNELRAILKEPT